MTGRLGARALLAFCLLGAACRSSPRNPQDDAPSAPSISSNVITQEEMAQAGLLGVTAFEAVQRLRPGYLIDRTAGRRTSIHPIQVSVNGGQLSGLNALGSIPVATIAEIRYLTTGEASQRFGSRSVGPVILVTLRVP
jgi:hypothetical protein